MIRDSKPHSSADHGCSNSMGVDLWVRSDEVQAKASFLDQEVDG